MEANIKITISTFGSRGDVEPPLALAVELRARHHQVTVVAPKVYAEWICAHDVGWSELRFDMTQFLSSEMLSEKLRRGKHLAYLRALASGLSHGSRLALDDFRQAARGADFVIQSGLAHGGVEIADELGIPLAFLYLYPMTPTKDFPSFYFSRRRSLGGYYNKWTQAMAYRAIWRVYGPPLNQWRAERLGLPPWRSYAQMLESRERLAAPHLLAYSPSLLPRPDDWSPHHHVTGFCFLERPRGWEPSTELLRFLSSGEPPVYIGFGSMQEGDSVQRTREVLRALEISGQRGILLTGGAGGLSRLPAPESVLYVDSFAAGWLFPQMAAIVHHGGAGTTAAALRAGVPSVVLPHVIDQHSWAERVTALGVGIRVGPLKDLRSESLAAAISEAVGNAVMRTHATALAQKVRSENGAASAADRIERYSAAFVGIRRGES